MIDPAFYSVIQRRLGVLEGIGFGLPDDIKGYYFETLQNLSEVLSRLQEESHESEDCQPPAP